MIHPFSLERCLRAVTALFLFLLPWQTIWIMKEQLVNGDKWQWGTLGLYGTEVVLWIAVGCFMAWYWQQRKKAEGPVQITCDRLFLASLLIFILYWFIASWWAADRSVAFQYAFRVLEASLIFLLLFLGPIHKKELILSFLLGALLQSVLAIMQFVFQTSWEHVWFGLSAHPAWEVGTSVVSSDGIGRWMRAYGAFPHPNILGGYIATAILFFSLFIYKEPLRPRSIIVLLLLFTGLIFSLSRSAFLMSALTVVCVCLVALWQQQYRFAFQYGVTVAILCFICGSLVYPLLQTRMMPTSATEIRSATERLAGYHEWYAVVSRHPWFGVGGGNYVLALHAHSPEREGWTLQPVHAAPLLLLAEGGIVSLFLLLLAAVCWIAQYRSTVLPLILLWIPLLPPLLLDHYLVSSYIGLILLAVYAAVGYRFFPHVLHNSSTEAGKMVLK
ncbi:MAG TPA: O-antigen ligase family protein [Candidatus Kapabacteria bacterium]|nr:O-antigen ligase family protein [Candidatus Kapabacteria bacterium]